LEKNWLIFMKNSKSKNKKFLPALILGIIIGIGTMSVAGVLIYQFSGKDMQSKIRYYFIKGKEYLKLYGQEKIANIPAKVTKEEVDDAGILYLNIETDKSIRTINPMIYGSNLSSKVEFQMDVAKFGKEIGITNFRFPGGNSFGYRWKSGTYDFNERFSNATISKLEKLIKFCEITGTELVIQVNIETGSPQEAAEWVQYMNNGQGKRVDYWELGNEAYGKWDRAYMTGEDYVKVIKEYSKLMKKVDPTIKIGANWGGPRFEKFDEAIARSAFDHIDFVSFHWYPSHINKDHRYKGRNHPLAKELMANSLAVGSMVKRFENMVDKHAPHRKGKIEFTIMEWDGSWDGVPSDLTFEYQGMMWSLANAIFYADTLGQFARHGITVSHQFAFQETMFGLIRGWDIGIGWGGSRWDRETIRPKALALKLFANHFGDIFIESQLTGSPSYIKEADWRADSYVGEVPYVSGYVSKSSENDTIVIVLTNKHADRDFEINISINGDIILDSQGETWILNGPNLKSQNDGSPAKVKIKKFNLSGIKKKFHYTVPPHSVNLLKIPFKTPTI